MYGMKAKAFTLAELLIALAILGVIATFTIPKVLQAQQDERNTAIFLEDTATLTEALHLYKLKNGLKATTGNMDISPYINYVTLYNSGEQIDQIYWNSGPITCDGSSFVCLRMHNGSVITFSNGDTFGSTSTTSELPFIIDPDGKVTQSGSPVNGPGKAAVVFLYITGRVKSYGTCDPGTASSWDTPGGCPSPGADPPYVKWSH